MVHTLAAIAKRVGLPGHFVSAPMTHKANLYIAGVWVGTVEFGPEWAKRYGFHRRPEPNDPVTVLVYAEHPEPGQIPVLATDGRLHT